MGLSLLHGLKHLLALAFLPINDYTRLRLSFEVCSLRDSGSISTDAVNKSLIVISNEHIFYVTLLQCMQFSPV
jgi:hypothetical protein